VWVNSNTFDCAEVAPDMQIWWRWGNAQRREPGAGSPCSSVRVTVSGSDVPSYVISRHPVNNGFLMQSCWVLLTSFKMPKQGGDPLIEDEALQVRYEDQSAEALQYNIGVGSGDDTEVTIEAELEDDRVIINAGGQTVLVSSFPCSTVAKASVTNASMRESTENGYPGAQGCGSSSRYSGTPRQCGASAP